MATLPPIAFNGMNPFLSAKDLGNLKDACTCHLRTAKYQAVAEHLPELIAIGAATTPRRIHIVDIERREFIQMSPQVNTSGEYSKPWKDSTKVETAFAEREVNNKTFGDGRPTNKELLQFCRDLERRTSHGGFEVQIQNTLSPNNKKEPAPMDARFAVFLVAK